eukprot:CCRYP_002091-RB/>CCRYP_002091-RB protein AED:0.50 eAED:0.40 QI:0/-1/0/1/-1/0/1/0/163
MGCMNDGSSDGTTYWYQMAMCRRAQVAYSVYATDSGSTSCNSNHFKGTVSVDGDWCLFLTSCVCCVCSCVDAFPFLIIRLLLIFPPYTTVCHPRRTGRIRIHHEQLPTKFALQRKLLRRPPLLRSRKQRILPLRRMRQRRILHHRQLQRCLLPRTSQHLRFAK